MPDALPGARTKPSYSISELTVTDNVTLLVWQRNLPTSYAGCTDQSDSSQESRGGRCTWTEAKQYCESAALAASLGGSGWRLPTKIELESILDETRFGPAIDTDAFHVPSAAIEYDSMFWSATPRVGVEQGFWFLEFKQGDEQFSDHSNHWLVRCVRSPSTARSADRYEVLANEVADRNTGLTWQRHTDCSPYNWSDAATYCLNLGGGWRLPALKELLTLVDPTRDDPALDLATFPAPSNVYWSASPSLDPSKQAPSAWAVEFHVGSPMQMNMTTGLGVRCVR